jgi:hypothetical protein
MAELKCQLEVDSLLGILLECDGEFEHVILA